MAEIADKVPTELRAGDTVKWRRTLDCYPAGAGWVVAYRLVGPTAAYTITAAADGDVHAVTIAAATSAAYAPGLYKLHETVSNDDERFTLGVTALRVLPDLAAGSAADTRSHARKVLDAIEAWLESKAPTAAAFEVAGRKLQNYPLTELLALRDRYRLEVAREERGGRGVRILTRFSR
jgi:hypothetical protein